jgi:hypothetical protein
MCEPWLPTGARLGIAEQHGIAIEIDRMLTAT